jgi:rod shape-determining protein MreD
MNAAILTALILVAAGVQARLPALAGLRLELLPALVAYGALTFRRSGAIGLALLAGLTHDALSAGMFGLTGLTYATVTFGITAMRDAMDPELPWVQMAAGGALAGAAALAGASVAGFTGPVAIKIIVLSWLSAALTVVVFLIGDSCRQWGRSR